MKTLITSTLLALTGCVTAQQSQSQLIISSNDAAYTGTMYGYMTDSLQPNFPIGGTGTNLIWDFTNLQTQNVDLFQVVDIANHPVSNIYQNATHVYQNQNGIASAISNTPAALVLWGERDMSASSMINFKHTLPDTLLKFNITFGSVWNDLSQTRMQFYFGMDPGIGQVVDSIRVTSTKQDHNVVDGEGTLTSTLNTFQVLRVSTFSDVTEITEFYISGQWVPFGAPVNYSYDTHQFWAENIGMPVATIQYDHTMNRVTEVKWLYMTNGTLGESEQLTSNTILKIFPNPVVDQVTIETAEANGMLEVYNTSGQLLSTKEVVHNSTPLDFSQFPTGTYVVRYVGSNRSSSHQIIKK